MFSERVDRLEQNPITLEEIHKCLSLFNPVDRQVDVTLRQKTARHVTQVDEALRAWTARLPNRTVKVRRRVDSAQRIRICHTEFRNPIDGG